MPPSLDAAVDELYSAFARKKRPSAINYCSHCISEDHVKQLLAPGPLREVPVEPLLSYTMSAADTVGSASDFRYFLPRILHILVTDGVGHYPDLEYVLRRLDLAGWPDWPAREREAVAGFIRALWSSTLARFPADPDVGEVLGAISEFEKDLTPYLREWETALTQRAGASHLRAFVHDNFGRAGTEYWLSVYWPDIALTTVKTWLGGSRAAEAVAAAATSADDETGDILLEILSLL